MDAFFNQKVLHSAVSFVQRAVEAKHNIPVLSFLRFNGSGGQVRITGTDLDVTIIKTVDAEFSEPFDILLPAEHLSRLVAIMDHDIALKVQGERVSLKSGPATHLLTCLPAKDWPAGVEESDGKSVGIQGSEFAAMLAGVRFAVNPLSTHRGTMFLNIETEHGQVYVIGTDGNRLSVASRAAETPLSALIPVKAARIFEMVCEDAESVEIRSGGKFFSVRAGNVEAISRVGADGYVNWRMVIPKSHPYRAEIEKAPLLAAIRRVCITCEKQEWLSTKWTFTEDSLRIETRESQRGQGVEVLKVNCPALANHDPVWVAFSANLWPDILGAIHSDSIFVEFEKPKTSCLIRPTAVNGFDQQIVLMGLDWERAG